MEMPPPVPAVLAPATVVAIEAAERPGILSMSSRVTVPPDAPPSLSINGTVYSTTSASSIITPAESSAFTKEILFAVIFTPVILRLWYPTKLKSTSYVPGCTGLIVYSPSKSVFVPETWFPLRKITTLANGSGSLASRSITLPFRVPEPTCAETLPTASNAAKRKVSGRNMNRVLQVIGSVVRKQ